VLLNLLSVGAIYGVLELVWRTGTARILWGIPATGAVDTFIPVMVFAFLYGLHGLLGLFGRSNWWLPAWAARPLGVAPSPAQPEPQANPPRDAEHQSVHTPPTAILTSITCGPSSTSRSCR
jgi:hypothetical protein